MPDVSGPSHTSSNPIPTPPAPAPGPDSSSATLDTLFGSQSGGPIPPSNPSAASSLRFSNYCDFGPAPFKATAQAHQWEEEIAAAGGGNSFMEQLKSKAQMPKTWFHPAQTYQAAANLNKTSCGEGYKSRKRNMSGTSAAPPGKKAETPKSGPTHIYTVALIKGTKQLARGEYEKPSASKFGSLANKGYVWKVILDEDATAADVTQAVNAKFASLTPKPLSAYKAHMCVPKTSGQGPSSSAKQGRNLNAEEFGKATPNTAIRELQHNFPNIVFIALLPAEPNLSYNRFVSKDYNEVTEDIDWLNIAINDDKSDSASETLSSGASDSDAPPPKTTWNCKASGGSSYCKQTRPMSTSSSSNGSTADEKQPPRRKEQPKQRKSLLTNHMATEASHSKKSRKGKEKAPPPLFSHISDTEATDLPGFVDADFLPDDAPLPNHIQHHTSPINDKPGQSSTHPPAAAALSHTTPLDTPSTTHTGPTYYDHYLCHMSQPENKKVPWWVGQSYAAYQPVVSITAKLILWAELVFNRTPPTLAPICLLDEIQTALTLKIFDTLHELNLHSDMSVLGPGGLINAVTLLSRIYKFLSWLADLPSPSFSDFATANHLHSQTIGSGSSDFYVHAQPLFEGNLLLPTRDLVKQFEFILSDLKDPKHMNVNVLVAGEFGLDGFLTNVEQDFLDTVDISDTLYKGSFRVLDQVCQALARKIRNFTKQQHQYNKGANNVTPEEREADKQDALCRHARSSKNVSVDPSKDQKVEDQQKSQN
ncbi:hypothetical protein CPB85DRAFT_1438068 [Mucidula mucida]|nr:hypothetical protein CPB85DRAFT_1438068 [Mucidula mucida]